ncbi:MAG: FimV/HubP family polar landmark protein [Pseudomonadota bacterium]|nr:FimV/HubP family polar landmark protein [Pseudomonadota bacterium]
MKISGLLWALLFAVGGVEAAGLGKLSVQSALGQPLKAEIELLSVNKDELPGITARLAGADAFRQARINRTEVLATLRFSVDQRANGQPVIRVSSSVPIADPFLDMLIEVNWNSGRLLREYTVLLDPPAEARAAAPVQPITAPEAARPAPPAAAPAPERRVVAEPAGPRAPEAAPARQPKRYGPVQGGETLRGIAGKVKQDGVTLEQMMVGLYQANRDAFFADNVNRLKRGQVLNVPDAETVHLQVSPALAARTLQSHAADWHAYRRKVAEMAGEAPVAKAPEAAAGKLAPKAEEKTAPAAAAPRDMLKLSKGEPGSAGRPDGKVQEKLHALEEELASRGRALQEAQDRVGQLERTVHDMQKLLELKAQEGAKAPAAPVQPGAAVAPEVPAEPVAPPPPVVAPQKSPAPVVLPAPVQQPSASWISTFISNPLYIGGIVAAVLLSVLLWMMMVGSRRRQGLNKFEDSIMTGGEFKNNAVFNAGSSSSSNAGAGANTEGSMLLTDFSRLGLGAIDTHEVDPIAEAEVYMAYGRDAQAEEILKEALNKDPNRHEIALKLLEIYAARKDSLAFETVASELYAGLGGQGTPVWQRAAEMGRSIDPSNPLYRATASDIPAAPSFSPKSNGRSVAPEAAPRSDFPHDMQQMDDWDAPALSKGSDEDFDIPVAPLARTVDAAPDDFAPMSQPPQQEEFTAPSPDHDFALEFEPAVSGSIMAVEKASDPIAEHGLSWDESPVQAEELEAAPVGDVEYTLETHVASEPLDWKEPEAGLEFADALAFDEVPEEVEAMPVLDLSGIDLEMEFSPEFESESEPEAAPVTVPPVHMEVEPMFEMPAPVEVETVAEAFVPADDFAPDMVEEFVPTPTPTPTPTPIAEPTPAVVEPEPEASAVAATPPSEEVADPELWEEVNTKLDLARAYLEMGDKEGAREILQEVLGEGDALQKSDADKLLAEAG